MINLEYDKIFAEIGNRSQCGVDAPQYGGECTNKCVFIESRICRDVYVCCAHMKYHICNAGTTTDERCDNALMTRASWTCPISARMWDLDPDCMDLLYDDTHTTTPNTIERNEKRRRARPTQESSGCTRNPDWREEAELRKYKRSVSEPIESSGASVPVCSPVYAGYLGSREDTGFRSSNATETSFVSLHTLKRAAFTLYANLCKGTARIARNTSRLSEVEAAAALAVRRYIAYTKKMGMPRDDATICEIRRSRVDPVRAGVYTADDVPDDVLSSMASVATELWHFLQQRCAPALRAGYRFEFHCMAMCVEWPRGVSLIPSIPACGRFVPNVRDMVACLKDVRCDTVTTHVRMLSRLMTSVSDQTTHVHHWKMDISRLPYVEFPSNP
jgi:hypothetical protein